MIQSSQPRNQRKFRYNAPLHERQSFVNAHVSKELASKLGIKKRSIAVRKGDTIKVMAGAQKGKSGKVSAVDLRKGIIFVDGMTRKTAKGKEVMLRISASNVYLTDLDTSDKLRKAKLDQFKVAAPAAQAKK